MLILELEYGYDKEKIKNIFIEFEYGNEQDENNNEQ